MKKALIALIMMFCSSLVFAACPSGMVSYWKLDQTTGPVVDSYDNHNGTTLGNVTRGIDGQYLNAFDFDNTDDYVIIPSFDFGNADFSVEAWVKAVSEPNYDPIVSRSSGSGLEWVLRVDPSGVPAFYITIVAFADVSVTGTTLINDSNWHHVVGVREDDVLKIYVDGALDATGASTDWDANNLQDIWIGAWNRWQPNNPHYDGSIDEVAIYDRALSASEVEAHYNNSLEGIDYCGVSESETIPEVIGNKKMLVLVVLIIALMAGALFLKK